MAIWAATGLLACVRLPSATIADAGDTENSGDLLGAEQPAPATAWTDTVDDGDANDYDGCGADAPDMESGQVGILQLDGSLVPCPMPKVAVALGEQVQVGAPVAISGLATVAFPCRPIVSWQWTLTKKPPGSLAAIPQAVNGPTIEITADLAGAYVVCLHVIDAAGIFSCSDACVEFVAMP